MVVLRKGGFSLCLRAGATEKSIELKDGSQLLITRFGQSTSLRGVTEKKAKIALAGQMLSSSASSMPMYVADISELRLALTIKLPLGGLIASGKLSLDLDSAPCLFSFPFGKTVRYSAQSAMAEARPDAR